MVLNVELDRRGIKYEEEWIKRYKVITKTRSNKSRDCKRVRHFFEVVTIHLVTICFRLVLYFNTK